MDWTSDDQLATVLHGDCLERLRDLPPESVHCCFTSPPYFSLRAYLPKDHPDKHREVGTEPTPEQFIATIAAVFREVRRVLREDGIAWLNLGTTYSDTDSDSEYLELRDDLAPEELAYVYAEMADVFKSEAVSTLRETNAQTKQNMPSLQQASRKA